MRGGDDDDDNNNSSNINNNSNIKQGQDLNVTGINNLGTICITGTADRTPKTRVGLRPRKTRRDKIEMKKKKFRTNISIIEELQKGSNVKKAKADKIKKNFGIKNQDDMAKTRVSKTTSPGQSTETKAIHQKGELLPAKQDLQGQCQKALVQRAGKESHHYPEPSSTHRGRDILQQNMGE